MKFNLVEFEFILGNHQHDTEERNGIEDDE